jgi:hypothetical protein
VPDDQSINLTVSVNAAQVQPGMQQAAAAVETATKQMSESAKVASTQSVAAADKMAAAFMRSGLSAGEAAQGMKNLGFAAAEATPALKGVGYAFEEIAAKAAIAEASNTKFRAGLVLTGSGVRVVAREMGTGFNTFTLAALGFVAVQVAMKIYDVVQNVILLKQALGELAEAEQKAGYRAAQANYAYIQQQAEALKAAGKVSEARELLQKNEGLKPIRLDFAIPKDALEKLPKAIQETVGHMGDINTQAAAKQFDWNNALKQGQEELGKLNGQLKIAQMYAAGTSPASLMMQGLGVGGVEARIEAVQKYLGVVKDIHQESQSLEALQANKAADFGIKKAPTVTIVEQWRDQWNQIRDLDQSGQTSNLNAEQHFWEQKLALTKAGTKENIAVRSELVRTEKETSSLFARLSEEQVAAFDRAADRQREWDKTVADSTRRQVDEALRAEEEMGAIAARGSSQRQEMETKAHEQQLDRNLKLTETTAKGDYSKQIAGVNQWADAEKRLLQAQEAVEKAKIKSVGVAATPAESKLQQDAATKYQELKDREVQIDQQAEDRKAAIEQQHLQQYMQTLNQMSAATSRLLIAELSGHRAATEAIKQMEKQLLEAIIQNTVRAIAAKLIELAVHKSVAAAEQLDNAKVAAGEAYKAMAGIPVIGPALGAVAAAVTFAAIMAFEKGGIIPETGTFYGHQGEAVLPKPLTTMLMHAASSVSTTNNSGAQFGDVHINASGGGSKQNNRDIADGIAKRIKSLSRANAL